MLRCRIHIYYRDHIHAHWIQLQAHPNTKEFLTTSTHRSSQPHTSPKGMCCCQTVKSSFLSSFSLSVLSVTAWRLDFPRSWAASIHTPVKDLRQQSKLSMDTHAHTHTGNSVLFNCSSRDTDLLLISFLRLVQSYDLHELRFFRVWDLQPVSRMSYGTPTTNKPTSRLLQKITYNLGNQTILWESKKISNDPPSQERNAEKSRNCLVIPCIWRTFLSSATKPRAKNW